MVFKTYNRHFKGYGKKNENIDSEKELNCIEDRSCTLVVPLSIAAKKESHTDFFEETRRKKKKKNEKIKRNKKIKNKKKTREASELA